MPILIVVNDPGELPLRFEGCELVSARHYLTNPEYAVMRGAKVFNLCRSYRYQSTGYYVSLLASARGHKPIPSISTIQDMKTQAILRFASEELEELIQKSLSPIQSGEFVLSIYFGHNIAKRHDRLSRHLFRLFEAPFLRAFFSFNDKTGRWTIQSITPIAVNDIPEEHRAFIMEAAEEYFIKKKRVSYRRIKSRYDLAILYDPEEKEPPSDEKAIKRFIKAAESIGLATELIQPDDSGRLSEFDGLFIRETTSVNHHTYRFARKAEAEGLVVIDDPESILKCTNKVFLAELLERKKIRMPKTVIMHRENARKIPDMLGFPCILKRPDSSFSQGVTKVEGRDELRKVASKMFEKSELIIAQEFLSTSFDWRVGILDRQPLYVCKYFMADRHWQIVKRDSEGKKMEDGEALTIPVEHADTELIRVALRAANLIGDGFYGVDIKQEGKKYYVIEINDNPSIDAGVEDAILKSELYLRIMRVILRRIELKKEKGYLM
ncbi:MAG: glutathione synthase [Nitrospira bacterium SG8_35_4]|nr:MAG: glutathione synthase [Nitrospira bacterium SG8_35_4]